MPIICQENFNGGEVSIPIGSRLTLEKRSASLKQLKNGFVHIEGCVSNRAGTIFNAETKYADKKCRIIPFCFNEEQQYIIELGNKYARFITNYGQIVYPSTYGVTYEGAYSFIETVQNSEEKSVYKYQLGDDFVYSAKSETDLAVDDILYSDVELTEIYRSGVSTSLSKGKISAIDKENHTIGVDVDEDKKALRGQVVEVETPYAEKDLFRVKYSQNADTLTLTCRGYKEKELSRYSHYDWILSDIIVKPNIEAPKDLAGTWTGGKENPRTYEYVVTAVNSDYEESIRSNKCSVTGEYEASWGVNEYITLNWEAVAGATEYNIYRNVNGIFGYIGTSETNSFKDDKIEPDIKNSAPIFKNPFDEAGTSDCSTYFQQRKLFGGFEKYLNRFVATQVGTSKNFNITRPLSASDAITINLSEREMNSIKHLLGMDVLIVFTSSAVYKSISSDGTFSASDLPATTFQCNYGSCDVQPATCGRVVLFVQNGGQIVRDLGYTYVSDSYDSTNLIIFARHLFKNKKVVNITFCDEPFHNLYAVMSDGTMNVLTYEKEQKVLGWSQYLTKGKYEDVCKIKDNSRDVAYFVVQRTINGEVKRFIESEASREISGVIGSVFSDCSLIYDGKATSVLSGLEHLANELVSVLADGECYSLTVSNDGKIELPVEASNIVVGLPYEFILETLNIEGEGTKGLKKRIISSSVEIIDSREDFVSVGSNGYFYQNERSYESVNNSDLLFNETIDLYFDTDSTKTASVKIIQNKPLPLCISSLETSIVIEENLLDATSAQN